jgi:hypothetical protein
MKHHVLLRAVEVVDRLFWQLGTAHVPTLCPAAACLAAAAAAAAAADTMAAYNSGKLKEMLAGVGYNI